MSGDRAVPDRHRPIGDQDLGRYVVDTVRHPSMRLPGAFALFEALAVLPFSVHLRLHVDGVVDRFVGHAHLRSERDPHSEHH